jgi:hypothetical protein
LMMMTMTRCKTFKVKFDIRSPTYSRHAHSSENTKTR